MKIKGLVKKEIERLTRNRQTGLVPAWVNEYMDDLVNRAIEIIEINNAVATDEVIRRAAFWAIDENF